jgi:hypothetical protein
VTLVAAPAARSQLITSDAWRAAGTLRITSSRVGAAVTLAAGRGVVLAQRTATGWQVSRHGGATQSTVGAGLSLDLGAGTGVAAGPDRSAARISIYATPGVRVRTDGLRLS